MSLLGESMEDRRDYRVGLAGLLAGTHALRILAEKGLASATDMTVSLSGVKQLLDEVPAWRPGEREHLEDMFDNLVRSAALNYGTNHD